VDDKNKIKPTPHPYIPGQYLNSLLEIETWLKNYATMAVTNDEQLPKDYSKEYMYDCFKVKGQD